MIQVAEDKKLICALFYPEDCDPSVLELVQDLLKQEDVKILRWAKGGSLGKPVVETIRERIEAADRVVAILNRSDGRFSSNVMYEVGLSHGLAAEETITVVTERSVNDIPFNLAHLPHLVFRSDRPQVMKSELLKYVRRQATDELRILIRQFSLLRAPLPVALRIDPPASLIGADRKKLRSLSKQNGGLLVQVMRSLNRLQAELRRVAKLEEHESVTRAYGFDPRDEVRRGLDGPLNELATLLKGDLNPDVCIKIDALTKKAGEIQSVVQKTLAQLTAATKPLIAAISQSSHKALQLEVPMLPCSPTEILSFLRSSEAQKFIQLLHELTELQTSLVALQDRETSSRIRDEYQVDLNSELERELSGPLLEVRAACGDRRHITESNVLEAVKAAKRRVATLTATTENTFAGKGRRRVWTKVRIRLMLWGLICALGITATITGVFTVLREVGFTQINPGNGPVDQVLTPVAMVAALVFLGTGWTLISRRSVWLPFMLLTLVVGLIGYTRVARSDSGPVPDKGSSNQVTNTKNGEEGGSATGNQNGSEASTKTGDGVNKREASVVASTGKDRSIAVSKRYELARIALLCIIGVLATARPPKPKTLNQRRERRRAWLLAAGVGALVVAVDLPLYLLQDKAWVSVLALTLKHTLVTVCVLVPTYLAWLTSDLWCGGKIAK